jgi:hypothetical protein
MAMGLVLMRSGYGVTTLDDSKLSVLLAWLERGWALVPLHDVFYGHCSCRLGPSCGSNAGKHPRYARWQETGQLVRDAATLRALLDAHPEWNWGVATGEVSGMWVLDWDVQHDAEILFWLESISAFGNVSAYARNPVDFDTLTLGPTGGGGRHYVFELPPDFEPRGAQTKNRHGLPPGLDIRGYHGQIVVAPSVSGKGPYGAVLIDAPIRRAPAWLEDMLRPKPEPDRPERAAPVADLRLSGSVGSLSSPVGVDARAWSYARSAVNALLAELAAAEPGTRDDTTIRVAYRLVELGNASWSGYTLDVLELAWTEARMMAADHAAVEATLPAKWARAVATVAGAAAVLPPSYVGGEHIPILEMASSGISGANIGSLPPDFAAAPALPFGDPITHSAPATAPVLGASPDASGGRPDPVQQLIDRMLTPGQLRALPPPRPLIRGLLDLDTCAWLIGKPGSCKSFVALDFAVHVGRGEPWQGRPVHQGLVAYIAAEGSGGMTLRVAAFEREYEEVKEVLFLPEPVPADERRTPGLGAWSVLERAVERLRPVMIIIDTQARVTIGLNENDNADMGYYAAQADRLRRACGACVLTVHHMGRSGTNARGASAIDGAQDAELRIERQDQAMLLKLHVDKQKDQAQAEPITLGLRRSEGGLSPDGRDLSSLVIVRETAADGPLTFQDPRETPEMIESTLGEHRAVLLYRTILERFNAGDGGTKAEIKQAFFDHGEINALSAPARRKAWLRAWGGSDTQPGLVPLGLIAQRAGAARFKVIVIMDQSSRGVLTPNDLQNPTLPPEGWNLYLPDESPRT